MTDMIAPAAPLPDWAQNALNLASPRMGTQAIRCSNDFFAPMARMLSDAPAVFKPDIYDDCGKWMDGWESQRRRDDGHDWCIIRLGVRATICGVDIDTSHFTGNYPPAAAIWAADSEQEPEDGDWTEIIPSTDLGPSAHHFVEAVAQGPWRWVRIYMYPDGGIARLRIYGQPVPTWDKENIVELSALKNGGRILGYNDAHYGNVSAVLAEGRGLNMGDGWETRRRREPGHDWLIIKLGAPGIIERIEVDTAHYKGNYPNRCSLQAARVEWGSDNSAIVQAMFWPQLMGEKTLSADTIHTFDGADIAELGAVSHVRLNIHPDGGISRLRIWGRCM